MLSPVPADTHVEEALLEAVAGLLAPLAKLAVARGLPFGVVEEMFKHAFVDAAREVQNGGAGRDISRVATATGLTRREVTRLSQETPVPLPAAERRSPATQIFARWRTDRKLQDRSGNPKALARQGPAPSFESLAQSVTRDVHPRSLLEELCRLELARHDVSTDTVHLLTDSFVPRDDQARMFGFLGHNVGDHLAASVANVLNQERKHVEQAIFADELSEQSIEAATRLVRAQWRALTAAVVPELEALIEADRKIREQDPTYRVDRRMRIGLYSFDAQMIPAADKEQ